MSKRIEWIDYAKGFTVLFVVLAHILGSVHYNMVSSYFRFAVYNVIGLIISTFIMPVFLLYLDSYIKTYPDSKNIYF